MPATIDAPSQAKTTAPVYAPAAVGALPVGPEFIRLPQSGKACPFTGLSRAKLNQLILPCELNGHKPPVKSHCLRTPGAVKGVRLIVLASLLDYIRSLES